MSESFFSEISRRLSELTNDDASACEGQFLPIREGEEVVSDVPEDIRKFCILMEVLRQEALALPLVGSDISRQLEKLEEYSSKCSIIREMFWIDLRNAMNLWSPQEIGVRKGWKVVIVEKKEEFPYLPLSPEILTILGIGRA